MAISWNPSPLKSAAAIPSGAWCAGSANGAAKLGAAADAARENSRQRNSSTVHGAARARRTMKEPVRVQLRVIVIIAMAFRDRVSEVRLMRRALDLRHRGGGTGRRPPKSCGGPETTRISILAPGLQSEYHRPPTFDRQIAVSRIAIP